jgi:hypothetical protein
VRVALALMAGVPALPCGCGSSTSHHAAKKQGKARPGVEGAGVPASAIAVIQGWANALREGHPKRAAAYWADPSVLINGPDSSGHYSVIRIETERQAIIADDTLPCGATLRSSSRDGDFIRANFTLSPRPGVAQSAGCSGPASVDFLIRDGLIVHWIRSSSTPGSPSSKEPLGGSPKARAT